MKTNISHIKQTENVQIKRIHKPNTRRLNKQIIHPHMDQPLNPNLYSDLSGMGYITTILRDMLIYTIPASLFLGLISIVDAVDKTIAGEASHILRSSAGLIIGVYALMLLIASPRITDHLAYMNVMATENKHDINRLINTYINVDRTDEEEFEVADHYRLKYAKFTLFPSVKELQVINQRNSAWHDSNATDDQREIAGRRKENWNKDNRRAEHEAAKAIADWKQAEFGGENEYDKLVQQYKNRTAPTIKRIIEQTQNTP